LIVFVFYVHVTTHRVSKVEERTNKMSQKLKFIHFHKSSTFRAPLHPSSGVQDYSCIWCSALVAVGDAGLSRDTGRVHYLKVVA
jgi:hypothetical protein